MDHYYQTERYFLVEKASVVPGAYFHTNWARPSLVRVLLVEGDKITYEYLTPELGSVTTWDRIGIFLLYLKEPASEGDWLCELLLR